MSRLFVLCAGGTGGHLFPAQAVARELLKRGHRVALLTDPRFAAFAKGFDGVEVHPLPMGRIGGGLKGKLIGAFQLLHSIGEARLLLKKMRPAAAVGFGGYPSVPGMAAAIWLKLPTMIHEQNRLAGRANRLLAKYARKVAASFPQTIGVEPGKVTVTGNPVRAEIRNLESGIWNLEKIHLLVFGGSQGARIFSEVVPEAVARLSEELRAKLRIAQQARAEDGSAVVQRYKEMRVIADIRPFFEDMPDQLAKANLVICRSGASTVAEMAAAGKAAIYAPYPHAADDHQRYNAEYMVSQGAGWLLPDAQFTPEALAAKLTELFTRPELLQAASRSASALAMPEAAAKLADMAEGMAA